MGFSLYARQQFSYILNLRSNMQTNGKETDKNQISVFRQVYPNLAFKIFCRQTNFQEILVHTQSIVHVRNSCNSGKC